MKDLSSIGSGTNIRLLKRDSKDIDTQLHNTNIVNRVTKSTKSGKSLQENCKKNVASIGKKLAKSVKSILFLVDNDRTAKRINHIFRDDKKIKSELYTRKPRSATKTKKIYFLSVSSPIKELISLEKEAADRGYIWVKTYTALSFLGHIGVNYKRIEELSAAELKEFILFAIGTNGRVSAYDDDKDSVQVSHCYTLNFNQYIGQNELNAQNFRPLDFYLHLIKEHPKLIFQAPAGAGKSTANMMLSHQKNWNEQAPKNTDFKISLCDRANLTELKKIDIDNIVILEPTTSITRQLYNDFISNYIDCGFIDGSPEAKKSCVINKNIIICCYDSFYKISQYLKKSLLIIDEYHQLVADFDYRDKDAFRHILDKSLTAKRVLMLSATPNYHFCKSKAVSKYFGFTLLKGTPSTQNTITIKPILYSGREKDIPVYVRENAPKGSGVVLGKFDSKATLNALLYNFSTNGLNVDILCSGEKKHKERNANYNSLMKSGKFADKNLHHLWFTTLLEAGVSIKEKVKLFSLVDTDSWQKAIQLINRPRYDVPSGTNKNLDVWLWRSEKSENKKEKRKRESLESIIYKSEILAGVQNGIKGTLEEHGTSYSHQTKSDINDCKQLTQFIDGKYEPCMLGILRRAYEQERNVPLDLMLKRIERFDERVIIQSIQKENTVKNKEFQNICEQIKIDKETAKERLIQSFIKDPLLTLQTVCYLSRNADFKRDTRKILNLPHEHYNDALDFLEKSAGAFSGKEPKRITSDIVFLVEKERMSLTKAVDLVINLEHEKLSDYKSQLERNERLRHFRSCRTNLKANDQFLQCRELAIIKKISKHVDNTKTRNASGYIGLGKITKMINSAVQSETQDLLKPLGKMQALNTLKDIFNVQTIRRKIKGKKRTLYKIGKQKTLKSVNIKR
jgi:hypothetical protein